MKRKKHKKMLLYARKIKIIIANLLRLTELTRATKKKKKENLKRIKEILKNKLLVKIYDLKHEMTQRGAHICICLRSHELTRARGKKSFS